MKKIVFKNSRIFEKKRPLEFPLFLTSFWPKTAIVYPCHGSDLTMAPRGLVVCQKNDSKRQNSLRKCLKKEVLRLLQKIWTDHHDFCWFFGFFQISRFWNFNSKLEFKCLKFKTEKHGFFESSFEKILELIFENNFFQKSV